MEFGDILGLLTLGGGLYSANGYRQAGDASREMGEFNARIDLIKADDAITRGRVTEGNLRSDTRKLIGSQRAGFAASGVDISDTDSTAQNVVNDTTALSEMDAATIRTNAAREAWGYKAAATQEQFKGRVAEKENDNRAIGTVLSTVGNVLYSKYGFGSTSRVRTY